MKPHTAIKWSVTVIGGEPVSYVGSFEEPAGALPFASVGTSAEGWVLMLHDGGHSMNLRTFVYQSPEKAMLHAEKWARPRWPEIARFPISR